MELTNKIVVITGASKGFGEVFARALTREEAKVVVSGRNREELEKVAKDIGGLAVVADVTDKSQVENLAQKTLEKFGKIDIWINNAGIQHPQKPLEDMETREANDIIAVNFFGTLYGSQVAIRQMKKQGYGTIINNISSSALKGYARWAVYAASKFAADGLTKSMRLELQSFNIQVFSIYPGGMQTHLFDEAKPKNFDTFMNPADVVEKVIANLKQEVPQEEFVIPRPKKS